MPLPSHAGIVVIGGGIIGCSTAYHLARDHKAEVVVLEQGKLTSGTTWHAAGLVGQLRSSASITSLLKRSVALYETLEAETGLSTGWKRSGCLRLATNEDRWIELRRLATTAQSFGIDMHLVTPAEAKAMWPVMCVRDLVGAAWLPSDGQANPSDVTQALARGARMHGARFFEDVRVTGFEMAGNRIVKVRTSDGDIACDKVVNCAGQWARQVGALAGISVPLQALRHQYIVTDTVEGLAADAPTIRDPDRRIYFKEEVGGLVVGGYEPDPKPWDTGLPGGDIPDDWQFRLFDDDFEHFEQHMAKAIARVPVLEHTGVKAMINGAESFTPDGNFILGAAPECANMFVGAGFNAYGIAAAGGAGWALAQWTAEGEAPMDLWSVDIRRFSALHRDRDWVRARTVEAYGRHYAVAYPSEEYASGRPALVSPLYSRLRSEGAVFGAKLGWERPNWFSASDPDAADIPSMNRANWFGPVGEEHRQVRQKVGIFDQSSFAKFELSGPDAARALDWICANDVTRDVGRLTYTQLLNRRGGIEADLTVARIEADRFYIVTGTGSRTRDFAWIAAQIPAGYSVRFEDVTEDFGTLSLMGPQARGVLQVVTTSNLSNDAFPFGHVRDVSIAGHPVRALRVTYVGELGWELHAARDAISDIYDALLAAGRPQDIRPVGYRALESLRLEKAYRAWGSDITSSDTPLEAGLGWAVKLPTDRDFLGRAALQTQREAPLSRRLVGFTVADPEAVLVGRETILRDGRPVGYLTSGGHGYTIGTDIGYGYVRNADGVDDDFLRGATYELVVANETVPATIALRAPYDPAGLRVRA